MNRLGLQAPAEVPAAVRRLTVVLVDEPSEIGCDLAAAMKLGGAAVIRVDWDPDQLLGLPPLLDRADAVVVPGSWPVEVILAIRDRLRTGPLSRGVLVYCEDGVGQAVERAGLVALRWPYVDVAGLTDVLLTALEVQRVAEEPGEPAPVAELVGRLVDYQRDLHAGREIQRGFLPRQLPSPDGWEIAARLRAAREVAGDFYDVFDLLGGRRIALVIADVCDKGVAAGLFMALIHTLLRKIPEVDDPGPLTHELLSGLAGGAGRTRTATLPAAGTEQMVSAIHGTNDYLVRMHGGEGYFATIFFGVLAPATGRLLYVNAGHLPGVVLRAGGGPELLGVTGPAVGLLADARYEVGEVELDPGDALLLHTDGVTDARNAEGGALGLLRLHAVIEQPGLSADELLERVDLLVSEHMGTAKQYDDMTTLAVRRANPADAAAGRPA